MGNNKYVFDYKFLRNSIASFINMLDNAFEPYKETIQHKKFPIYINNTGDEIFMSNLTDVGENKTELYKSTPRMELSISSMGVDVGQFSSGGIPTNIGVRKKEGDKKILLGKTLSRRVPINLTMKTKVSFGSVNEYLKFVEYFLSIYVNNSFSFKIDYNNIIFNGVASLALDFQHISNYSLGFDSENRNRVMEFSWNIDLQMPAYNIHKLKNIINNDLDFDNTIWWDDNGWNDDDNGSGGNNDGDNDGTCSENQAGWKKLYSRIFINEYNEQGFVVKTSVPKDIENEY